MAKDLREEKGEDLRGGKALGGKGGKGSEQGKGGKDLREEREKIWGQRPWGQRGEMISTGKGVEKILGRKGRRSGGKKANRERGKRSKEGKGRSSQGGKSLRGERVGRISTGKGGKQS